MKVALSQLKTNQDTQGTASALKSVVQLTEEVKKLHIPLQATDLEDRSEELLQNLKVFSSPSALQKPVSVMKDSTGCHKAAEYSPYPAQVAYTTYKALWKTLAAA